MKPRYKIYVYPIKFLKTFFQSLFIPNNVINSNFESKLNKYLNSENALFVNQARIGVFLTIKSIIDKTGKTEIIVSPYTIADVINMVILAGGEPVFVDIEEDTCNINHNLIEENITENCSAILVTHLHGRMCNMKPIKKIADKYSVYLIEDAAQSFGAKQNGQYAGTIGDVGIFSFGLYKNVSSIYGGAVVSKDKDLFKLISESHSDFNKFNFIWYFKKLLKGLVTIVATSNILFRPIILPIIKFGYFKNIKFINKFVETELDVSRKTEIPDIYLTKPSKFQTYLAYENLSMVKNDEDKRIEYAKIYQNRLNQYSELKFQDNTNSSDNIYTYFPVYLERMQELRSYLIKNNIDVGPQHYKNTASILSFEDFYKNCSVAERVSKNLLLLPTYPRYGEKNITKLCDLISLFFKT